MSETLTFEDLSDPERQVWEAVATGELVDLRNGDDDRQADLVTGASWGFRPNHSGTYPRADSHRPRASDHPSHPALGLSAYRREPGSRGANPHVPVGFRGLLLHASSENR